VRTPCSYVPFGIPLRSTYKQPFFFIHFFFPLQIFDGVSGVIRREERIQAHYGILTEVHHERTME
jgi:hypothetical protein